MTQILRKFLDNGAEVCTKTLDGSNVIHLAVKYHSVNCLNMLLEYPKIDINDQVTSTGLTALSIAVEKNYKNIVEKLVKLGANLNCKDKNDRTSLHIAVEQGNEDMVKLFLRKGIDVNAITREQCTPLEIALTSNYQGIVEIILDYNPDINIKNKDGLCPLFTAIKCCSIELFSLKSNLNIVTNDNSSILHYALQFNNDYIIHNLLEEDISFTQNIFGEHPLHISCKYCNEIIVSKILNKNVDVNVKTIDGSTPLHSVTKYCRSFNLASLLNCGPDINAENNKKETPSFLALKGSQYAKLVEMLLKYGSDPNHIADDKTTPLHWAIVKGRFVDIPELLIKHGAYIDKMNGNNDSCLHLLLKNFCIYSRQNHVELFIKNGVDVNGINKHDETPLELSLTGKQTFIAEYKRLIEAGAI